MNSHTRSTRIALSAAGLAAACWAAKAVSIDIAGGLDKSPFEGPLFFAGLIAFVVAVVSLGVALTRGRPAWLRAIAGVVAFIVGLGISQVVGAVATTLAPADPSWVWAEVELWVIAPLALAAAWMVAHRQPA